MADQPASEGPRGPGPLAAILTDPNRRGHLIAAIALAVVAATEFVSVALTRDVIVAAMWVIFGVVSVLLAYFLFRGNFNAWGTAIIVNLFAEVVAAVLVDVPAFAALIASDVVLYVVRVPFGVGAWKIETKREDETSRGVIASRTRNPQGIRCPKCGSDHLWVADDGSAFCLVCRAGTIELGPGAQRAS